MKRKISPEELESRTEEYFLLCDGENEKSNDIIKPYTLSGLLYHLEITRDEYRKMLSCRKYSRILVKAAAKIEAYIEENVLTGELSVNAGANSLKYNFGWGEKRSDRSDCPSDSITVSLSPEAASFAK